MSRCSLAFWLISLLLCFATRAIKAQVFELQGNSVVFPITLIIFYPFISGTVNGVAGKFMFDTGHLAPISINDNFINLPYKRAKGNGAVGSGQSFKTSVSDTIREIKLVNRMTYQNVEKVTGGNYDFLQQYVTPDFLALSVIHYSKIIFLK